MLPQTILINDVNVESNVKMLCFHAYDDEILICRCYGYRMIYGVGCVKLELEPVLDTELLSVATFISPEELL